MSKLAGAYAAVRVSKLLEDLTLDEKHDVLEFCIKCVQADLIKESHEFTKERQAQIGMKMEVAGELT